jgi:hypothetical protein
MKRLALVFAVTAVAALPSAAEGAACSPLNCAPSQFTLAHGTLLGFRTAVNKPVRVIDLRTGATKWRLPDGLTGGNLLVHQDGASLVWYDAAAGTRLYDVALPNVEYSLAGVSQDGTRAVAFSVVSGNTSIVVISRDGRQSFDVDGKQWQFDALLGDNLFLIHYVDTGGYQVRLLHADTGRLEAAPLKDPHESGTIWGQPFSRLSSQDGRYLFTLYIGSNGASMIHELDLKAATARCIDLPGTGNYGNATSWALVLSKDGRTLWAVSPGYGHVVAIDVATRAVTKAFPLTLPYWNLGNGTAAALAPDGRRIAVADGQTVAVVDLAKHRVTARRPAHALGLGYSPAGRLWKLS